MKRYLIVLAVIGVLVLAGLSAVGIASARSAEPACPGCIDHGRRMDADGEGPLHDYMLAAFAEALDLPVSDLEVRLEAGESLNEIAQAEGVPAEDFFTWMAQARAQALQAAVDDGALTQEQADWMLQHQGQRGSGLGRGIGTGQADGRLRGGCGFQANP